MYGQQIALDIYSSPAYLPACLQVLAHRIETTLWECVLFFFPSFRYAPHILQASEDNAVWRTPWWRMLFTVNHRGVLSSYNEFFACFASVKKDTWGNCLHKNEDVAACIFCSLCIGVPSSFLQVVNGSLQQPASQPVLSQPAMWSISTLIKLTVIPNSNQKGTTTQPDSVSAAAKTCFLVCKCQRQKIERHWKRGELIAVFGSHFVLVSKILPRHVRGSRRNTNKNLEASICCTQYIQMSVWWREIGSLLDLEVRTKRKECRGIVINSE